MSFCAAVAWVVVVSGLIKFYPEHVSVKNLAYHQTDPAIAALLWSGLVFHK